MNVGVRPHRRAREEEEADRPVEGHQRACQTRPEPLLDDQAGRSRRRVLGQVGLQVVQHPGAAGPDDRPETAAGHRRGEAALQVDPPRLAPRPQRAEALAPVLEQGQTDPFVGDEGAERLVDVFEDVVEEEPGVRARSPRGAAAAARTPVRSAGACAAATGENPRAWRRAAPAPTRARDRWPGGRRRSAPLRAWLAGHFGSWSAASSPDTARSCFLRLHCRSSGSGFSLPLIVPPNRESRRGLVQIEYCHSCSVPESHIDDPQRVPRRPAAQALFLDRYRKDPEPEVRFRSHILLLTGRRPHLGRPSVPCCSVAPGPSTAGSSDSRPRGWRDSPGTSPAAPFASPTTPVQARRRVGHRDGPAQLRVPPQPLVLAEAVAVLMLEVHQVKVQPRDRPPAGSVAATWCTDASPDARPQGPRPSVQARRPAPAARRVAGRRDGRLPGRGRHQHQPEDRIDVDGQGSAGHRRDARQQREALPLGFDPLAGPGRCSSPRGSRGRAETPPCSSGTWTTSPAQELRRYRKYPRDL